MKGRFIINTFILFLIFTSCVRDKNALTKLQIVKFGFVKELYPILLNNRWGFIDTSGNVIIEPKFQNTGLFKEGLCKVRLNGTFGFINSYGELIIPHLLDYASEFDNGVATVWKDGKSLTIDKSGKVIDGAENYLGNGFSYFSRLDSTCGKYRIGLKNKSGKIILDAKYDYVTNFCDGISSVNKSVNSKYFGRNSVVVGLIDTSGRFVSLENKYIKIGDFNEGIAVADYDAGDTKWGDYHALIDKNGTIIYKFPPKTMISSGPINHYYSEGLIGIWDEKSFDFEHEYATYREGNIDGTTSSKVEYTLMIDTKGNRIIDDIRFHYIYPFKEGKSFAGTYREWWLIDKKGKFITSELFYDLKGEGFKDGLAIVESQKEKWGVINTKGDYVIKPIYDEIENSFNEDGTIWVSFKDSSKSNMDSENYYQYGYNLKWGSIDKNGNVIIEPQFSNFKRFGNGITYVEKDNSYGYINSSGKFIWKAEKKIFKSDTVDIDFMIRGHYYASNQDLNQENGHGISRNFNKPMGFQFATLPKKLILKIDTNFLTQKNNEIGYATYILNASYDTIVFAAQDSRLYMKMQAKDKKGNWRDIEYLPSSWCGNSYHNVYLPPYHYWEFFTPKLKGEFQTEVRLLLTEVIYKNERPKSKKVIFSNSIICGINPAQFWREKEYFSNGIMDPYFR